MSAGICCAVTMQDIDAPWLLKSADDAQYRAKRAGRNRTAVEICTGPRPDGS